MVTFRSRSPPPPPSDLSAVCLYDFLPAFVSLNDRHSSHPDSTTARETRGSGHTEVIELFLCLCVNQPTISHGQPPLSITKLGTKALLYTLCGLFSLVAGSLSAMCVSFFACRSVDTLSSECTVSFPVIRNNSHSMAGWLCLICHSTAFRSAQNPTTSLRLVGWLVVCGTVKVVNDEVSRGEDTTRREDEEKNFLFLLLAKKNSFIAFLGEDRETKTLLLLLLSCHPPC